PAHHRALHSFPTRRSSDLGLRVVPLSPATGAVRAGLRLALATGGVRNGVRVLGAAVGQPQRPAALDVVPTLLLLLLRRPGVARRQLDRLLGLDTRLQLAAAFQLGVELRAEEQREVHDPQPQEEDDDAA